MVTLILILTSCTNSGLGLVQTADTGPFTLGCPWEGEWKLTEVKCGTSGAIAYNEWYTAYDATTMKIEASGTDACAVEFAWSAAECAEEEAWTITPTVPDFTEDEDPKEYEHDGKAQVNYEGITDCSPAGCEFEPGDIDLSGAEACEEGDRTLTASIEIDSSVSDVLTIEGLLNDPGRHDCPLGIVTTWSRQ